MGSKTAYLLILASRMECLDHLADLRGGLSQHKAVQSHIYSKKCLQYFEESTLKNEWEQASANLTLMFAL